MQLSSCQTILVKVLPSEVVKGTVLVPETVTTIGHGAFYDCTSLTTLTLPAGVTTIGIWAFYDCTSLKTFTLPAGVTTIGNWAFQNCTSLRVLTLPDSVTTIGAWAFEGCKSLTTLTLPAEVTTIDYEAFEACTSLKTIIIDSPTKEAGEKVRALLPEHLRKKAVIQNVALEKAKGEITPLIQRLIADKSFPLGYDNVCEIFRKLIPLNQIKNCDKVFNHLYDSYHKTYNQRPLQNAKNDLTAKHASLFKEAKSGFFGFFRNTKLQPDWSLKEIIGHGMAHKNRTRQVCVEMGWLNKDGTLSKKAPDFIKEEVGHKHPSNSTKG